MKSQLKDMNAVVVAPVVAQSQLARYVQADIKGGDFKLSFLQSLITLAVTEAYKNNGRAITEAATFAQGRAKKARAYHAGLAAIGECKPIAYKGKYDSADNAPIREEINLKAQAACARFTEAFNTVMAEKAAPKASKPAPEAAPEASAAPVMVLDGDIVETVEIDANAPVQVVADLLAGGMLSAADVLTIRAALAQFDMMQEQVEEMVA